MGKSLDYTSRQKRILDGSLPVEQVEIVSLKHLLNRAIEKEDKETINTISGWLAKRKQYSGYTLKQQAILSGSVKPDEVTGQMARYLLAKATKLNDENVIAFAQKLVSMSHERHLENNRKRAMERNQKLKEDIFEWKQPKASDYSEHHRKVIRGEIPLEKVATRELITIHMLAKSKGDFELSERMLNLIIDRREDYKNRRVERLNVFRTQKKYGIDDIKRKSDPLTAYEKAILRYEVDLNEVSEETLKHIIAVCDNNSDTRNAHIANLVLHYKRHPESVYITQDHDEAIDMIEKMIGKPIRRPESWFISI